MPARVPTRICSLLPSATEIVGALGLVDLLVGVSEECDFPSAARGLPVVTGARIDTSALTSVRIDAAVRSALADGSSLYAIDEELLTSLAPDLILTQDLCTVCAVSSGDVALCGVEAETMVLDAHSIAEIGECVLRLGARLGVAERARAVVREMEEKIAAVRAAVGSAGGAGAGTVVGSARGAGAGTGAANTSASARPAARRPRVFVAEWLDPPFAAGHWVPEMVELAGGLEVLGRSGQPSYATTWERVAAERPDLVVLAPCGFDAQRAAAEAGLVPDLGCRVVAVDANAYYSRPAPRVADGVAQLGHLLHPEAVPDPGLPYVEISRG